LNRNWKGKTKYRNAAVENLIKLISSDCAIEVLHIASIPSNGLKLDLIPFITALGNNTSLGELDISGHQIGNRGAQELSRSLQTNNTLSKLLWDENQIGFMGFKNIKYALQMNKTIKFLPLPVADVVEEIQLRNKPEEQRKLCSTLAKIERIILNNQAS